MGSLFGGAAVGRLLPAVVVVLLASLPHRVGAANILVLSPYTCRSHTNFVSNIVRALAQRGHALTYWNGLEPRDDLPDNVRQLFSDGMRAMNTNHEVEFGNNNPLVMFLDFPRRMSMVCSACHGDPVMQELANATVGTYDVVLVEAILNECMMPLVHHLGAPFIYLNSIMPAPWHMDAIGAPMSLDHVPLVASAFTSRMNLLERTWNAVSVMAMVYFRDWFIMPRVDRSPLVQHWPHGPVPSAVDVERNVSMMLTNTHPSLNYNFPKPPNIIEVGGLHCRLGRPLPADLEEFVAGAGRAGFIYLSFGSILRGSDLPEATVRVLVRTFGRLPQRVVWKYEGVIDDLPSNIRLSSWLPQQDLLAHDNIRLFITHGGLFSLQESVYHGVPLIGMPVFADQISNVVKAVHDGYAVQLDWSSLSERNLAEAIQTVLSGDGYRRTVAALSRLMKEQPETPLRRAAYWVEHVIEHRGATHLQSPARHLPRYQRAMFDVTVVLLALTAGLAWAVYRLTALVRRLLFPGVVIVVPTDALKPKPASADVQRRKSDAALAAAADDADAKEKLERSSG